MGLAVMLLITGVFYAQTDVSLADFNFKNYISTHEDITPELEKTIDRNLTYSELPPLNFDATGLINEKIPSNEYGLSWVIEDFKSKEKFVIVHEELDGESLDHFFVGLLVYVEGWQTEETLNGLPIIKLDRIEFAFERKDQVHGHGLHQEHKHHTLEELKNKFQGIKIIENNLPHSLEFEIVGDKNVLSGEPVGFSMYYTDSNDKEISYLPDKTILGYNWYEDKFIVKTWGYEEGLGKLKLGIMTYAVHEDIIRFDVE